MAIDDARDDDGRGSDAVGDFLEERGCGAQGGGSDGGAGVAVDDCGDEEVDEGVHGLEEVEGAGVVLGSLELGHEAEEVDVACGWSSFSFRFLGGRLVEENKEGG